MQRYLSLTCGWTTEVINGNYPGKKWTEPNKATQAGNFSADQTSGKRKSLLGLKQSNLILVLQALVRAEGEKAGADIAGDKWKCKLILGILTDVATAMSGLRRCSGTFQVTQAVSIYMTKSADACQSLHKKGVVAGC